MSSPTIGVFDSGFGGLTVLRALLPLVPGAYYLYLGDTARLPYGAKSQATIARYAVESARFLAGTGADHLVIACNTATALALPEIRAAVSIPVTGVIAPGAQAALALIQTLSAQPSPTPLPIHSSSRPQSAPLRPPRHLDRSVRVLGERAAERSPHLPSVERPQILVLATTATVHSHAYRDACAALGLHATEKACPLLVPLVEEGWTDHPVTRDVLRIYLTEALATCSPTAVLLGCTHYPLIASAIQQTLRELGSNAIVIDSADATAQAVAAAIPQASPNPTAPATFTCYATDSIEKFQHLGSHFLGQTIPQVHHLDLGG